MAYTFSSHEIALLAADVELASAAFYRNLSRSTSGLPIGEVFSILADQEKTHERSFRAIAKVFRAKDQEYDFSIDLSAIMKYHLDKLKAQAFPEKAASRPVDMAEALEVALAAEKASVDVYTEMRLTYNAEFQEILDGIIRVESDHYQSVLELKTRLNS
jgi:rubrerythrin